MKQFKWFGLAVVVLIAANIACGGGTATSEPQPTSVPPTSVPRAQTAELEIVNNSGESIWYLYLSPSSSSDWGDDQLGASIISDGDSFTISDIAPGTYDIKAEDSDHNVIEVLSGQELDGPMTWNVVGNGSSGGDTASLTIINSSGTDIWYVYLSPSSANAWGSDQLGSSIVYDGESYTITDIPFGTYDVKAEDSSHNVIETWFNQEFDGEMSWTVVGGGSSDAASLTIINNTGQSVWYVYISPSSSSEWGEDQLGANTISDGESFTLTGIAFGTYDLKAENASHEVLATEMGVEMDGPKTWTLSGGGMGGELQQWAAAASASSEYGSVDWSADQATGAPDTPECGDYTTAWASETAGGVDWLALGYATPVIPSQVAIYQSYSPSYVSRVEVVDTDGQSHVVWTGEPGAISECPYVLNIWIDDVNVPVNAVIVYLDQSSDGVWNEIDAVQLIGLP